MSWSYFTNAYVAAANALSIKTWPSNTDGNIWHAMDAGGVTRQEVIYSKYKHLKQHDIYKRVTYTMLWEDAFFFWTQHICYVCLINALSWEFNPNLKQV